MASCAEQRGVSELFILRQDRPANASQFVGHGDDRNVSMAALLQLIDSARQRCRSDLDQMQNCPSAVNKQLP
jgi:hypothetical protein